MSETTKNRHFARKTANRFYQWLTYGSPIEKNCYIFTSSKLIPLFGLQLYDRERADSYFFFSNKK